MEKKLHPDDPYNLNLADVGECSYISTLLAAFFGILEPGEAKLLLHITWRDVQRHIRNPTTRK